MVFRDFIVSAEMEDCMAKMVYHRDYKWCSMLMCIDDFVR